MNREAERAGHHAYMKNPYTAVFVPRGLKTKHSFTKNKTQQPKKARKMFHIL